VSPRTFNNYFGSKAEAIVSRHLDRSLRAADALRRRPAGEPLWQALTAAAMEQLESGPEVDAMPMTDQTHWAAGLQAMLSKPELQGEMLRAGAQAEAEMAAAVAERTGTDLKVDMYPHLVAAAYTAAKNVATQAWLRADEPVGMEVLLSAALAQFAAGLPAPVTSRHERDHAGHPQTTSSTPGST
jgi:AcrR family transcriptional regulator